MKNKQKQRHQKMSSFQGRVHCDRPKHEYYMHIWRSIGERETWKSHSFASNVYFNAYAYRVCVCVVYDNVVRGERKKNANSRPEQNNNRLVSFFSVILYTDFVLVCRKIGTNRIKSRNTKTQKIVATIIKLRLIPFVLCLYLFLFCAAEFVYRLTLSFFCFCSLLNRALCLSTVVNDNLVFLSSAAQK